MSWIEICQRCTQYKKAGHQFITLPVDQVLAMPAEVLDTVSAMAHDGIMAWHNHDLATMRSILEQLYGRIPCPALDVYRAGQAESAHSAIGALEQPQPSGPAAGSG